MIETDIIIIGAGPVGLFTVFEAGLLKLRCHLIDSLPQPGGQCSEIYPKKPIYDIPGFPSILAGELIDNLMEQAAPFKPGFTLGEAALSIDKTEDEKLAARHARDALSVLILNKVVTLKNIQTEKKSSLNFTQSR
jgi:thioredoxin reductase (NADPH)